MFKNKMIEYTLNKDNSKILFILNKKGNNGVIYYEANYSDNTTSINKKTQIKEEQYKSKLQLYIRDVI